MKIAKFVLPVIAAAFATPAFGSLSNAVVADANVPAGFVANAITWDGGGTNDWTSAGLVVNLTSGTAYQDAFGADAPPNPAFFPTFPALEFDTYVGILEDGTAGIAGGAGDVGGGPLSLDAPQISVSWFNTDSSDTGVVQIAMVTLSDDAQGTFSYISQGVRTDGAVINGVMGGVPEPASMALLGLGGLALLRRR